MFVSSKKYKEMQSFYIEREKEIRSFYIEREKELVKELQQAREMKELLEKLTDKTNYIGTEINGAIRSSDFMAHLDDSVPRYVPDHFGGRCIKQEATNVTILSKSGQARYALTAKKPKKGEEYILIKE